MFRPIDPGLVCGEDHRSIKADVKINWDLFPKEKDMEKLKTKEEVRKEIEKDLPVLEKYFRTVTIRDRGIFSCFDGVVEAGGSQPASKDILFKLLTPPAKGKPVFIYESMDKPEKKIYSRLSAGTSLEREDGLRTFDEMCGLSFQTSIHPTWYDPETGQHTPDFPIDKIPEDLRHPDHRSDCQ